MTAITIGKKAFLRRPDDTEKAKMLSS